MNLILRSKSQNLGFTLISTLILLTLLIALVTATGLALTSAQRNTNAERDIGGARSAALSGLEIALGELQAAAGPDTRITAPASILTDGNVLDLDLDTDSGKSAWTGVWRSNIEDLADDEPTAYDQSSPDDRHFYGWLASNTDSEDRFILPGKEQDSSVGGQPSAIRDALNNPVTLARDEDGEPYLEAGLVQINDQNSRRLGDRFFAFAVEDEGVKADLQWRENPDPSSEERGNNSRLSAAPGPDYTVFQSDGSDGPFPFNQGESLEVSNSEFLRDGIDLIQDPTDLQSLLDADEGFEWQDWMKENRSNFTYGVKGLLVDVKKGGLRHDLSLAFEMDGEKDFEWSPSSSDFVDLPTKFNQLTDQFVADEPQLDEPGVGLGSLSGWTTRYVFGDTGSNDGVFSNRITNPENIVRGPCWSALRDYAISYKRLRGDPGNYAFSARTLFPYDKTVPLETGMQPAEYESMGFGGGAFNQPFRFGSTIQRYLYREMPVEVNNTPVMLGFAVTLGVLSTSDESADTRNLAMSIDPLIFLWNPYNRTMEVDNYVFTSRTGMPGELKVRIDGEELRQRSVQSYVGQAAGRGNNVRTGTFLSYSAEDLTFAPGEIKIISPATSQTEAEATGVRANLHPYNTRAVEGGEGVLSETSGTIITRFPSLASLNNNNWQIITLEENTRVEIAYGMPDADSIDETETRFTVCMPDAVSSYNQLANRQSHLRWSQTFRPLTGYNDEINDLETFEPASTIEDMPFVVDLTSTDIQSAKTIVGVFSLLTSPTNHEGANPTSQEVFAQFNPLGLTTLVPPTRDRFGSWNQETTVICRNYLSNVSEALEDAGIILPTIDTNNGYWGNSYAGDGSGVNGSTALPMLDFPESPIQSLVQFASANLGIRMADPMYAVGNSFANVLISPEAPYGELQEQDTNSDIVPLVSDTSWLLNDALFDSFYLSGLAPEFNFNGTNSSYNETDNLRVTLANFFETEESSNGDYRTAEATPVLRPYVPENTTAEDIVDNIDPEIDITGFRRLAAFSTVDGTFNINSTSVKAWTALLRANRDLEVTDAEGDTDSESGSPFARGVTPPASDNTQDAWIGTRRLDNDEIDLLAAEIVNQVKIRGPFMSISDFVNRRVGTTFNEDTRYMGALQAAIEASGINDEARSEADSAMTTYDNDGLGFNPDVFPEPRPTSTGIATDISQADVLLPLAPRISARSDTFRIRAYGDVRNTLDNDDSSDDVVISRAVCEAVVQRYPEYFEADLSLTQDDGDDQTNQAWDNEDLSALNQRLGRRFRIVQFRWLSPEEI